MQAEHEIMLLPGGRHDFLLQRIVSPPAQREAAGKQHKSAKRKQTSTPSAAHVLATPWLLLDLAVERGTVQSIPVDRVIPVGAKQIIHRGDPRTRHRQRRRHCACAIWQTDTGRSAGW